MRLISRFVLLAALLIAPLARATVPTETSVSGPYTCSGTTGPYTVGFRFLDNAHLVVTKKLVATGAESTLALTADYSVSGAGSSTGGTITLVAGSRCGAGYTLTVKLVVPITQTTAFSTQGGFSPKAIENALDRATMIAQRIARDHQEFANTVELGAPSADHAQVTAAGGTAPIELRDFMALSFNAKALGAAPSATGAQNRDRINAALLVGAGKTVEITEPGTYQIDGEISVSTSTHFVIGPGVTLWQRAANTKLLKVVDASGVTIDGGGVLKCYGIGDTSSTYKNQLYSAPTGFSDSEVRSCADSRGIDILRSDRVTVRGLKVEGCRNFGVLFRKTNDLTIENLDVTGTYPADVGGVTPMAGCQPDVGTPNTDGNYSQFGVAGNVTSDQTVWSSPAYKRITVRNVTVRGGIFGVFSVGVFRDQVWDSIRVSDVAQHCAYMYPGSNLIVSNFQCVRPWVNGVKIQAMISQYAYPVTGISLSNIQVQDGRGPGGNGVIVTLLDGTNPPGDGDGNRSAGLYRDVKLNNISVSRWPGVAVHIDNAEVMATNITLSDVGSYGLFTNAVDGLISNVSMTRMFREPVYLLSQIGRTLRLSDVAIKWGASRPPAWQASRAYAVGDFVSNGGNWYTVSEAGTSAASVGPAGVTQNIADGTVLWSYFAAAQNPSAYVLALATYDPPSSRVTGQWYGAGSILAEGTRFYRAAWDGVSVGTTVTPLASTDPAVITADGSTAWQYIGSTSSPRGRVYVDRVIVNQGPRDNVGNSINATSSGAAGTFQFYSSGSSFPEFQPDGVTTLYASLTASIAGYEADRQGHGSTASVAVGAGGRGRPGRDFIVHDAAGLAALTGYHNIGDRAWQDQPSAGTTRPLLWICTSSGAPCTGWKPIYVGATASNSDFAGSFATTANVYTLSYSQTFATAPLCTCTNTAAGGTCNSSGHTTSQVVFRTSGATDTFIYHCTPRN